LPELGFARVVSSTVWTTVGLSTDGPRYLPIGSFADQAQCVTTAWVLLLTDDPRIRATTARLADSVGVAVRPIAGEKTPAAVGPSGAGPPALVVLGADRLGEPSLPPEASGVARLLVAAGEPDDRLWRAALEVRAEQVVLLPEAEHVLLGRLSRLNAERALEALIICVTGGCGGAGASVLAAALARAAAGVARSLLIDLDPIGSGADLLLGAEDEPGLRWPDLASARGRLMPGSLAGALPVIDGLHVLSWDRSPNLTELPVAAVTAVLEAARQEYQVVVLDLPRALDAGGETVARAADLGLLVVPAEVRAATAARRVLTALRRHLADVRLLVRGPAPTGLRAEAVADALDLPLIGVLKPEPGLRVALDRGEPPGLRARGPLSVFCRDFVAGELAEASLERRRAS
jgi:secretion/DNA translocation related CpaE-like protein